MKITRYICLVILGLLLTACVQAGDNAVMESQNSITTELTENQTIKTQASKKLIPAKLVSEIKQLAPKSWPNWMGPNHDGISHEKGWSSDWPEKGLPVDWTREIGIGFSSISIDSEHLFTMGHVEGKEFVYCLNPETGEEIWSYSYPCELVDNLHEGGPGSTPTIDGKYVYTVGREGQVFCFQKNDGKIIWERDLQKDLKMRLPEWGFTSSPYILNNQLILNPGAIVSYDKSTGDINWKTKHHNAGYGSVISFPHDNKTLLASLDCDGLRVVQSSDGTEIDFYECKSPFRTNSTTPIIKGDKIYISNGYQVGCSLLQLEGNELKLIYKNRKMRNHFNNSILWDGHLYGFDGNSNLGRVVQLKCMNFETGKVVWRKRGLGCGSLMIADGKLLLLTEDGKLVLAKATSDGFEELAESDFLEGRCWTVPVLFNGHVYGRNATGKLVSVKLPE